MSCSQWESQLEAFADGELAADLSSALREHLSDCSQCRDALGRLRAMRAALVRTWANESAPVGLAEQVRARLSAENAIRRRSFERPDIGASENAAVGIPVPASWNLNDAAIAFDSSANDWARSRVATVRSPARQRWGLALATVGTLALVIGLYQTLLPTAPTPRDVTVVAGDRFADIRRLHSDAVSARGANLAALTIPNMRPNADTLANVAARLSALSDLTVLVPDLSNEGYELLGAGPIEFGVGPAVQVFYTSAKHGPLSVFSLQRWEGIATPEPRRGVRSFFATTLKSTSLVGWHDGRQTYVLCSNVEQESLFRLVDELPTAERGIFDSLRSVLALASDRPCSGRPSVERVVGQRTGSIAERTIDRTLLTARAGRSAPHAAGLPILESEGPRAQVKNA